MCARISGACEISADFKARHHRLTHKLLTLFMLKAVYGHGPGDCSKPCGHRLSLSGPENRGGASGRSCWVDKCVSFASSSYAMAATFVTGARRKNQEARLIRGYLPVCQILIVAERLRRAIASFGRHFLRARPGAIGLSMPRLMSLRARRWGGDGSCRRMTCTDTTNCGGPSRTLCLSIIQS